MPKRQRDDIISRIEPKSLAQKTPILFFWIDEEEHYKKFDSQEERDEFIRHLIHLFNDYKHKNIKII